MSTALPWAFDSTVPWWSLIRDDSPEDRELREDAVSRLAEFLFDPAPWKEQAACHGKDPDLFFMKQGVSSRRGRAVCRTCAVEKECKQYALDTGSEGVWGGEVLTPKVRGIQDARPAAIEQPVQPTEGEAVVHPGFGKLAGPRS